MTEILKSEKKYGIHRKDMFYKIGNGFVRTVNNKFVENGREYYFAPTKEGILDYSVFLTILYNCNGQNEFDIRINKIIKSLGKKPQSGIGRNNDNVKQSIKRLEQKFLLRIDEFEDSFVSGEVLLPDLEKHFFKLYENDLIMIMNNLSKRSMEDDEFISKYKNKEKAIYVYSYLLSMLGKHETTEAGMETYLCFPSYKQIAEECGVSESYINKLLAYLEYDELLFSIYLGDAETPDGNTVITSNYYTNSIENLSLAYCYARAYYDNEGYKYPKYAKRTKQLLEEISNMLVKSKDRLLEKYAKKFKKSHGEEYAKTLIEKEYLKFKEHFYMAIKKSVAYGNKIHPDITSDKMKCYIATRQNLKSKFYNKNTHPSLLFIADNESASIILLSHIKQKLKALMYLYNIK